jgi:drug/metabolite transporter (DMT)-like permease
VKLNRGILSALAAAALFGLSTPIAKTLLGEISPLLLAGLLYAGSGVGLSMVLTARSAWDERALSGPVAPICFGYSEPSHLAAP